MKERLSICSIIILLLITFFIPSCESMKNDPEFIGTWMYTEKITSNGLVYNTSRSMKLTRNSYEETYVIQRENSVTVSAILGTRGDLALTHSNLTFILEELGTCTLDDSDVCTGEVSWYGEGTWYWRDNIQYFEKTVAGEYEVDGATLWLIRDLNNDGDMEDTGEDIIFEKV